MKWVSNFTLVLILSIGLLSCNNSEVDKISIEYNLVEGQEILVNEIDVIELEIIDTFLFLRTRKNSAIYKVYSIPGLDSIGIMGYRGNGPNEFLAARYMGQETIHENNLFAWIEDPLHFRFMEINITQSINRDLSIRKLLELSPKHPIGKDLFYINDTLLIGNSRNDALYSNMIIYFNPISNETINFIPNPDHIKNENSLFTHELYEINSSHLKLKPDKSMIVCAYNYFDKMYIYDISGNLLKVVGNIDQTIEVDRNLNNELTNYYFDIEVSDKYIYALYYNQLEKDYAEVIQPTYIRIYNWEGTLIHAYEIPEYLMSFCIDEENNVLYGLAFYESMIKKYDLN